MTAQHALGWIDGERFGRHELQQPLRCRGPLTHVQIQLGGGEAARGQCRLRRRARHAATHAAPATHGVVRIAVSLRRCASGEYVRLRYSATETLHRDTRVVSHALGGLEIALAVEIDDARRFDGGGPASSSRRRSLRNAAHPAAGRPNGNTGKPPRNRAEAVDAAAHEAAHRPADGTVSEIAVANPASSRET